MPNYRIKYGRDDVTVDNKPLAEARQKLVQIRGMERNRPLDAAEAAIVCEAVMSRAENDRAMLKEFVKVAAKDNADDLAKLVAAADLMERIDASYAANAVVVDGSDLEWLRNGVKKLTGEQRQVALHYPGILRQIESPEPMPKAEEAPASA